MSDQLDNKKWTPCLQHDYIRKIGRNMTIIKFPDDHKTTVCQLQPVDLQNKQHFMRHTGSHVVINVYFIFIILDINMHKVSTLLE